MATNILTKNSPTTTNVPANLEAGELAVNVADQKLWVGDGTATPVPLLGGSVGAGTVQGQTLRWDEDIAKEWQANSTLVVNDVGVEVLAGTAALPSYTFTGDPDTGMWWAAANEIAWSTAGAERMRIDSGGNVGIGTTTPTDNFDQLHVDIAGAPLCSLSAKASGGEIIRVTAAAGEAQIAFANSHPLIFFSGISELARITATGEVMIAGSTDRGAYNLQCNGTGVWGQGAYANGSDGRWKDDVEPLTEDALAITTALQPVSYRMNELSGARDTTTLHAGFIAQDVEAVLEGTRWAEGVVQTNAEGYKSMAYQELIPVLVKSIQELTARLEAVEGA